MLIHLNPHTSYHSPRISHTPVLSRQVLSPCGKGPFSRFLEAWIPCPGLVVRGVLPTSCLPAEAPYAKPWSFRSGSKPLKNGHLKEGGGWGSDPSLRSKTQEVWAVASQARAWPGCCPPRSADRSPLPGKRRPFREVGRFFHLCHPSWPEAKRVVNCLSAGAGRRGKVRVLLPSLSPHYAQGRGSYPLIPPFPLLSQPFQPLFLSSRGTCFPSLYVLPPLSVTSHFPLPSLSTSYATTCRFLSLSERKLYPHSSYEAQRLV